MLKCSKAAFAACPDRKSCGCPDEAVFTEGSECDKFNREIAQRPMTNADCIKAMSDEELATLFADDERVCPPKHHNCKNYIDKCDGCWLEWLQQPAQEV